MIYLRVGRYVVNPRRNITMWLTRSNLRDITIRTSCDGVKFSNVIRRQISIRAISDTVLYYGRYNKCGARRRSFVRRTGRWRRKVNKAHNFPKLCCDEFVLGIFARRVPSYTQLLLDAPPRRAFLRQISSGIYFSLSRYTKNFELPKDAENYYNY